MQKIIIISALTFAVGVYGMYLYEYYSNMSIENVKNCLQIEGLSRELSMESTRDICSKLIR